MGSVELHLFSSGWIKHRHSDNANYRNVILHVVWEKDKMETTNHIPQLELSNRVPRMMLVTYTAWMHKPVFIPCELSASVVVCIIWEEWASSLLIRCLNRKMYRILESLDENNFHWEEQLWWMMATQFGNPVNRGAFEAVARSIPFSLLAKHRYQLIQLESLLLGQANLLEDDFRDSYAGMLKREFIFLRKKYGLNKIYEPVHFLRMRP